MERISEALEKSRQGAEPFIRPGLVAQLRDDGSSANPGAAAEIRYTRTRTVTVSKQKLRQNRIISGFEPGGYKDSYKILCTQVLQRLQENKWNALAITSPGLREGKSLTAINLAISLGMEVDKTVLLVDADLRAPRIHRMFDLPPGPGLSDYLMSDTPLEDILVHPDLGRFVILPGGRPIPNSSEMLGSRKMMSLVQELKSRYPSRIVLFDLPPVLSAADALAFSPYVDAAVMVIEEGGTDSGELVRAAEMLGSTRLIGTVLNKSRQVELEPQAVDKPGWLRRLFNRPDA